MRHSLKRCLTWEQISRLNLHTFQQRGHFELISELAQVQAHMPHNSVAQLRLTAMKHSRSNRLREKIVVSENTSLGYSVCCRLSTVIYSIGVTKLDDSTRLSMPIIFKNYTTHTDAFSIVFKTFDKLISTCYNLLSLFAFQLVSYQGQIRF